eukprot:TRINITY_DN1268_c0_g1_i6.p1 TRINITY_DN1268_c0_g1~~TRINITY_DN1268_c0_g1_i6.p1  ORF type:complete len:1999 (+),score=638.13 TRINITY_DN1268_c0_g1_i6:110-6106(+)
MVRIKTQVPISPYLGDSSSSLVLDLKNGSNNAPLNQNEEAVEKKVVDKVALSSVQVEEIYSKLNDINDPIRTNSSFHQREKSLKPPTSFTQSEVKFPPENDEKLPQSLLDEAKTKEELTVLGYQPEGTVKEATQISITFSAPVLEVATLEAQESLGELFSIEPKVDGTFRYRGTKTIAFEPKGNSFPKATNYKVSIPAGYPHKSDQTNKTEKDFQFEFTIPGPRLLSWGNFYIGQTVTSLQPGFLLTFDQQVDPNKVLEKISVFPKSSDKKNAVELKLLNTSEAVKLELLQENEKYQPLKGTWVAFKVSKDLKKNESYSITVGPSIPSNEGPLLSTEASQAEFRTYGPLVFLKDSYNPQWGSHIPFSNSLDNDDFQTDYVTVNPPAPSNTKIYASGNNIFLEGLSNGKYQITISKRLKDTYGQSLGEDVKVDYERKANSYPMFQSPIGSQTIVTLDPFSSNHNKKWEFPIYTSQWESVRIALFSVDPKEIRGTNDWHTTDYNSYNDPSTCIKVGKKVYDEVRKIEKPNIVSTIQIDLTPALQFPNEHLGHAILWACPVEKGQKSYHNPSSIFTWVQLTRLGVSTVTEGNQVRCWVNDLLETKPIEGATLVVNAKERMQGSFSTDAAGRVLVPFKTQEGEIFTVRKGNDSVISTFSSYYENPSRVVLHSITDRNMYKPSEKVRVKGWLRMIVKDGSYDKLSKFPPKTLIHYTVRDPRWTEIHKGQAELNEHSSFELSFDLKDNVNLGTCRIEYQATEENSLSSLSFEVQEFRTPELTSKVELENKEEILLGDEVNVTVSANYYSGGALADVPVGWNVTATNSKYNPPGWYDFEFSKRYRNWGRRYRNESLDTQIQSRFSGTTNSEGKHTLSITPSRSQRNDAEQNALTVTASAVVKNENQQVTSGSTQFLVHASSYYVGIKNNVWSAKKNTNYEFPLVVVNPKGEIVSGRKIDYKIVWKKRDVDKKGTVTYEDVVLSEGSLTSSGNDGRGNIPEERGVLQTLKLTPEESGNYEISLRVMDDLERIHSFVSDLNVGGEEEVVEEKAKVTMASCKNIKILLDKEKYEVGDTATLTLKAPFQCKGWYQFGFANPFGDPIEIQLDDFNKTEKTTELSYKITERDIPNVNFHVFAEGFNGETNLPEWAEGRVTLQTSLVTKKLRLEIIPTSTTLTPGCETDVKVIVRDHKGEPVPNTEVCLIAVDEAILSLSNYKPLEDWESLFYPGATWNARTRSSRHQIYGTFLEEPAEDQMKEESFKCKRCCCSAACLSAPGGGAGQSIQERSNFDPLAAWFPSVITDSEGKCSVHIMMPDSLTKYRVWAYASTTTHFGFGESGLLTQLPLSVRPSFPRFLNFGDKAVCSALVLNQSQNKEKIKAVVRTQNAQLEENKAGFEFELEAGGQTVVHFPVSTRVTGPVAFQIAAITESGSSDSARIVLPVFTPATSEAFATYGEIKGDKEVMCQSIQTPKGVFPDFGGLDITTSSTIVSGVLDAYKYVFEYPYGCAEQTATRLVTSVALKPVLVAFSSVDKDLPDEKKINETIQNCIKKLAGMQNGNGGFGFWTSNSEVSPYVTLHVVHSLLRSKKEGDQNLLSQMINKALSNYINNIDSHISSKIYDSVRRYLKIFAFYVRHLNNEDVSAHVERLLEEKPLWKEEKMEALCWAYQTLFKSSSKLKEELKRHFLNAVDETAETAVLIVRNRLSESSKTLLLDSERKSDGIFLETLILTEPKSHLIPKFVRGLMASKGKRGYWYNTQENCFVLLAIDLYFRTFESKVPSYVSKQWLGETYVGEFKEEGRSKNKQNITIPMSYLVSDENLKSQNLLISKEGAGILYYRIGLNYAPLSLTLDAKDVGFQVVRNYEGVDHPDHAKKDESGVWRFKLGEKIRVTLLMTNKRVRYHVALSDKLPAGLEVLNTALKTTESLGKEASSSSGYWWNRNWFNHQNMRDERVEAFSSYLWPSEHKYSYVARTTSSGRFVVPPAMAEEMYSPEIFGRSSSEIVIVE